jgi:hypothetical protein
MATAAAWVTWAAWADIDSPKKVGGTKTTTRGGKQFPPRFCFFAYIGMIRAFMIL